MVLQSRSLEFISGNFQTWVGGVCFFFFIPWLSYKKPKQTELKIQ